MCRFLNTNICLCRDGCLTAGHYCPCRCRRRRTPVGDRRTQMPRGCYTDYGASWKDKQNKFELTLDRTTPVVRKYPVISRPGGPPSYCPLPQTIVSFRSLVLVHSSLLPLVRRSSAVGSEWIGLSLRLSLGLSLSVPKRPVSWGPLLSRRVRPWSGDPRPHAHGSVSLSDVP